jgi:hypothetical protein
MDAGLNYRQRMFVSAYLGAANGNGTLAATAAGYAKPGETAYKLLKKTQIRAEIARKTTSAALGADEVLGRLAEIASGNWESFIAFDDDGKPSLDLNQARKAGKLGLIRTLRVNRHGTVSIDLLDPIAALSLLGRYHNLWDGERSPRPPEDGPVPRIHPRGCPTNVGGNGDNGNGIGGSTAGGS